MNQDETLAKETLKDQEEAQELLNALPDPANYYTPMSKEDKKERFSVGSERDREHVAYSFAMKDAVIPFFPEGEYVFQEPPTQVNVTTDNTVTPYRTVATYEDGTIFYEGEGHEGLIGLYEAQTAESRRRGESRNYYLYDDSTYEHCVPAIFGPGVPPLPGAENVIRTLHSTSSVSMRMKHIRAFSDWAKLYVDWVDNPEDFYTCFSFVKSHPAMWLNEEGEDHIDTDREAWLWHEVVKNDAGETVHMFETGTAVKPERQQHYHTLELDVYSDTYEQGIINLAWLINKYSKWDGTERDTIEREENELITLLKERIEDIEENPDKMGPSYLM